MSNPLETPDTANQPPSSSGQHIVRACAFVAPVEAQYYMQPGAVYYTAEFLTHYEKTVQSTPQMIRAGGLDWSHTGLSSATSDIYRCQVGTRKREDWYHGVKWTVEQPIYEYLVVRDCPNVKTPENHNRTTSPSWSVCTGLLGFATKTD